ncbi:hypothetical protein CR513_43555, partial [Mucuna pruriens]
MEKKGEKYVKNVNKGRKEVFFKEGDLVWVHLRKEFPHLSARRWEGGSQESSNGCSQVLNPFARDRDVESYLDWKMIIAQVLIYFDYLDYKKVRIVTYEFTRKSKKGGGGMYTLGLILRES